MSGFAENLSYFMTACRNDILEETCRNLEYANMKSMCMELSERLQSAVAPEQRMLLVELLDDLSAIGILETSYCYLCGLRDGNKPDTGFDPGAEKALVDLAAYERYADIKAKCDKRRNEFQSILDDECRALLNEYIKTKDTMIGVEKFYCYSGGLRDKKRLNNQFDPSVTDEWHKLMAAFL